MEKKNNLTQEDIFLKENILTEKQVQKVFKKRKNKHERKKESGWCTLERKSILQRKKYSRENLIQIGRKKYLRWKELVLKESNIDTKEKQRQIKGIKCMQNSNQIERIINRKKSYKIEKQKERKKKVLPF